MRIRARSLSERNKNDDMRLATFRDNASLALLILQILSSAKPVLSSAARGTDLALRERVPENYYGEKIGPQDVRDKIGARRAVINAGL